MGDVHRIGKAGSLIIVASAAMPLSVNNTAAGVGWCRAASAHDRSSRGASGQLRLPACGPPRQVLSWKPSATDGSVEKNWSVRGECSPLAGREPAIIVTCVCS